MTSSYQRPNKIMRPKMANRLGLYGKNWDDGDWWSVEELMFVELLTFPPGEKELMTLSRSQYYSRTTMNQAGDGGRFIFHP